MNKLIPTISLLLICQFSEAQKLAITRTNLIPMDREGVLSDMTILVNQGTIQAIGSGNTISIPEDFEIIDGKGKFVMPGLIDIHAHVDSIEHFPLYLAYGITTVRNGHGIREHLQVREKVTTGEILSPDLWIPHGVMSEGDPAYGYIVMNAEETRKAVRDIKDEGYDWIKTVRLSDEIFFAMADEAVKQGVITGGHLPSFDTPLDTIINSGWNSVEHIRELVWSELKGDYRIEKLPPLVEKIRRSGITVSTLLGEDFTLLKMLDPSYPESVQAKAIARVLGTHTLQFSKDLASGNGGPWMGTVERASYTKEFILTFIKMLHEAGVPIVAGTDSYTMFGIPGETLLRELGYFVEAGLTPFEVLKTATYNAAQLMRRLNEVGTLQVGMKANLILLGANPLEDLAALKQLEGVSINGRWLDQAELKSILKPLDL